MDAIASGQPDLTEEEWRRERTNAVELNQTVRGTNG